MDAKKISDIKKSGKKAIIDDVADVAGVSKATVSRVMNRPNLVNDFTAKRVKSAMDQLNYSPNSLAQSMRSQKTKTIGVIVPELKNTFYSGMIYEIERVIRPYDYMLTICPTSGVFKEEKDFLARIMHRRVDGIMYFTYNNSKRHIEDVLSITKKIPFILMDEPVDDLNVNQVITNGYSGMMEATDYLVKKGHKNIACVCSKTEAASKRLLGYVDSMKKNGMHKDQHIIIPTGFDIADGEEAAKIMLQLKNRPTAVVCVADSVAIGVLKQFYKSGVKVPDEIEVIGFNNSDLSEVTTPTLSTIGQNMPELAANAVRLMMDMMETPFKSRTVSIIKVDSELIIRESTK